MKKRSERLIIYSINVLTIILFVLTLIFSSEIESNLTSIIATWGYIAMILIVIILEGAPVFAGPSLAVAAMLLIGANPLGVLIAFLVSSVVSNVIYFSIGVGADKSLLKFFDKEDINLYRELLKKYGSKFLIISAVSPIPYLPTIGGFFGMEKSHFYTWVLASRLLRHLVVFAFWYLVIVMI